MRTSPIAAALPVLALPCALSLALPAALSCASAPARPGSPDPSPAIGASPPPSGPRTAKDGSAVVIHNARIWGHPGATAILVTGQRVEKLGGEELLAFSGARTIDAGGGLVLPGFHDAHIHMMGGGLSLARAQLAGAKTMDDTLARAKAWADAHPERPWVLGRGWSYDIVPKGQLPTAKDLDRAIPDRPAVLRAYDGHTAWLNTKALEAAKITKATRDPADGKIARDAKGNPTGALLEGAMELLAGVMPAPERAEKKEALYAAALDCVQKGLTAVDAIEGDVEEWELLLELEREGKLPLRVNVILPIEGNLDEYVEMRKRGTERVKLVGVKGFVDGVIESKTAFMKKPYAGTKDEIGRPLIPRDELFSLVEEASKRGFFVALHAIGDGAVALSLDAFARAPALHAGSRHRVEHIEALDPEDAVRFERQAVLASMQPYHAVPGEPDPDQGAWPENLGKERLKMSFAWRTLVDARARLTFGSDWPVFTNDPLAGLAVALSRRNESGTPADGWNAHQKLLAREAIEAYSEGRSLNEGQLADLVVLPPSVKLEEPMTLFGAAPSLVMIAGSAYAP
jgi:predicted amidohydrolase YtcJ